MQCSINLELQLALWTGSHLNFEDIIRVVKQHVVNGEKASFNNPNNGSKGDYLGQVALKFFFRWASLSLLFIDLVDQ